MGRPGEVALDIARETAAVGRIDLTLDSNGHRRRRITVRAERGSVVVFALVERPGVRPKDSSGVECGHASPQSAFHPQAVNST
jgi:hypothetical protein